MNEQRLDTRFLIRPDAKSTKRSHDHNDLADCAGRLPAAPKSGRSRDEMTDRQP
jgi:hypothetical protein